MSAVRRSPGGLLQGQSGRADGSSAWRAGEAGIDYRHVIGSLVRKPGAFARYRYREQMFPTGTFRLAYDALREWRGERADVDYVRILHLAATTMESEVDRALGLLLEAGIALRLRGGAGAGGPGPATAFPELGLAQGGGPEGLRPSACGGCAMSMGRVSSNGVKERIGQLCSEFKLPTVGAEAGLPVHRSRSCTDALVTLVEVLEQEAEDRRQRRIIRTQTSIQAARRQDMGHLRARQGAGRAQTAARRAGRWELRRARCQCPGFRTARHRQDPRHVCHRPQAG